MGQIYDRTSLKTKSTLLEEYRSMGLLPGSVEVCHILGEATMHGITGSDEVIKNKVRSLGSSVVSITHAHHSDPFAATAMAVLKDFGLQGFAEELLAANGVHNLGNLLSLHAPFHTAFDMMAMWFEGTEVVGYLSTYKRYQPNVCAG